ncbi:transcription-repair coupling factor [Lactobacillus iners]|jgi:transcription-repair coupling factor|uniref:transcription-repair coupling factor n=1 Tax=Lactobacillus iners TaxID=147802 RepID=UPI000C9BEE55|nr:transcription-repair coupling factor [Lactobacillus iners]MDK8317272.1 transcription-repair coupling factor [Lactobacillus iners]MDK8324019.1 transcription-repair coupling factor [Lactobacillus iners]MDK8581885.1 transcription-repair coupling factor [Lactobacillus iners]MDK8756983.1 transcription-repair coupling factor [Lactobacillus iners]PMC46792.1 transcription-repair coupling factor [Lactobacillus iners]
MKLSELIAADANLVNFIKAVPQAKNSMLTGVNFGAFNLIIRELLHRLQQPILIVASDENRAQQIYSSLVELFEENMVHFFPVEPLLETQAAVSSLDELSQRLDAMSFLLTKQKGIVISTPQALQYPLPAAIKFKANSLTLKVNQVCNLSKICDFLVRCGYKRDDLVANPGEFALRGDILDIYPINIAYPYRIEFFDDEIDNIRTFNPVSQRTKDSLTEVVIEPADDQLDKLYQNEDYTTILDYLTESGIICFDDIRAIRQNIVQIDARNRDYLAHETSTNIKNSRLDFTSIFNQIVQAKIYSSLFQVSVNDLKIDQLLNLHTREPQQFFSQMSLIKNELSVYELQQQTVIIQADNLVRAKQIKSTFADYGIDITIAAENRLIPNKRQIIVDNFNQGFVLPRINLVYLTEHDLFNRQPHIHKKIKSLENAQQIRSYQELNPGDYVVHINHGIGIFEGIKTLESNGKKGDYITITYRNHDQLFVPADQLGVVQKYVASDGKIPKINKLGGNEWAKTKCRVQEKIEDIADELLAIYAHRATEKGFAFLPDDELQRDFEASFPYLETPDQIKAIKEIKLDMQKEKPMDRLLVGDVGFGKTEVALRAAFKAIDSGKQVAFLVPTTILAEQHYATMLERFKDFPVNVAMLCRFQTEKEADEIATNLSNGKIDIVVGTHRILSRDIKFKNLGLLIIDEEQRFGVKHKEKLKKLKNNIDVLTLTATPIPRTLHMSMIGVRDLSVMETPPANRYPIQTYVTEETPNIVREACLRELARNGQIFFLHNKIQDIDQKVAYLSQLIPEARIEYIHGRMSERQLEDIMLRFTQKKFDILVTTTIIETGVDLPNVNTLLVENADTYGLSQLYQLRGRIGRSSRLAYAYFLYKRDKVLTEVSEKRLNAIRDFTALGSGFKIAMRDLSIRGAGNILGKQQHGFIDSVGYDLYAQMLDQTIKQKRGDKVCHKTNAEVRINLEAYIPTEYISSQKQKIEFYKKIKHANDVKAIDDIADELIDRFGTYPKSVENLLNIATIKVLADTAQILSITNIDKKIDIVLDQKASEELKGPNIFRTLEHVCFRARVSVDHDRLHVRLILDSKSSWRTIFNELKVFLQAVIDIVHK